MLTSDAREATSGECGTYAVPDPIRDALADASDVAELAERWARTEELQLDHWSVSDARELLAELQPLARDARANERSLYVWWTL
jgi:hypothetical protein